MSTKKQKRDQKKREKARKKAEERSQARAERTEHIKERTGVPGKSATLQQAAEWPISEAWISTTWYEQGAQVQAIFTREREDGRMGATIVDVDLEKRGVLQVKTSTRYTSDRVMAEVTRRSSETHQMIQIEGELVVKLVREAQRHGNEGGHEQPPGLQEAMVLFGKEDGTSDARAILFGPPPPPQKKKAKGIFALLERLTRR